MTGTYNKYALSLLTHPFPHRIDYIEPCKPHTSFYALTMLYDKQWESLRNSVDCTLTTGNFFHYLKIFQSFGENVLKIKYLN